MQTVIIGSGNVAYHMAKAFTRKGIPLAQIFGRNEKELKNISEELNIPHSIESLKDADLYIICVSDNSVEDVSKIIQKKTVWLPTLQVLFLKKYWQESTGSQVFIRYRRFQNQKNWSMKRFHSLLKLKMRKINNYYLSLPPEFLNM